MSEFKIDPKLEEDSHLLGNFSFSQLRLINNALVPWFILVPKTSINEFHCLPEKDQLTLLGEINMLSGFVSKEFQPDKINIATIGNIVRQMHVHIIARYRDDFCWPNVVWGRTAKKTYLTAEVTQIREKIKIHLGPGILAN